MVAILDVQSAHNMEFFFTGLPIHQSYKIRIHGPPSF